MRTKRWNSTSFASLLDLWDESKTKHLPSESFDIFLEEPDPNKFPPEMQYLKDLVLKYEAQDEE